MSNDELLERLRPGYRLMSAGRRAEWLQLLDPEVELHQDPNLPGTAGSFHGHPGALAMMAEIDEAWGSQRWEPVEARRLEDGRYLVRVRIEGVGRESGVPLETELGHLITTRDGLTTRLDTFRDWDAARRAGGLAE